MLSRMLNKHHFMKSNCILHKNISLFSQTTINHTIYLFLTFELKDLIQTTLRKNEIQSLNEPFIVKTVFSYYES